MRIAVLGAGAQGAGIGADLTRTGYDVTLIEQWPRHVEAMRADGVTVVMPAETQVTPVNVIHLCEVATLRHKFDLVFVVVKAYDTRWAAELLQPYLADDGLMAGLQNGMSFDSIIAAVGDERALGGVIEMASNMYEPGVVNRQNPPSEAWFALGGVDAIATARAEAAAAVLRSAGNVEVTSDIRSAKWMKLIVNAGELVPSAILNLPLGDAVALPGMRAFMLRACREALDTALDTGHRLVPIFGLREMAFDDRDRFAEQLLDAVLTTYSRPDTRTTVLQDWDKGRHSEVDEINGLVVTEQKRIGGFAPANDRTVGLARRIEAGELAAGPENLELLVEVMA